VLRSVELRFRLQNGDKGWKPEKKWKWDVVNLVEMHIQGRNRSVTTPVVIM
jgi:hypothetical protein